MVLAILGFAIGISYSTANRSLLNARQAQENTEATELAQSQLEALRVMAPTAASQPAEQNIYDVSHKDGFCVSEVSPLTIADIESSPGVTNPACIRETFYTILVLYCGANLHQLCIGQTGPTNDNFVVQVSWDNVRGLGQDTVKLTHRIHKP